MTLSKFIRWGGLAAMLGGLLWVVGAILTALQPRLCREQCELPGRSMRTGTVVQGVILIAAVLLIGFGALALAGRAHAAGRFGRLRRVGLAAALGGGAVVLLATLVQAALFAGDFPFMPFVVVPGGLAVVLGFVLLALAILGAGILPRWAGALLVVGTLAMLGFNDQNDQAVRLALRGSLLVTPMACRRPAPA